MDASGGGRQVNQECFKLDGAPAPPRAGAPIREDDDVIEHVINSAQLFVNFIYTSIDKA